MSQREEAHKPLTILLVEDDLGHSYLIETNLRRSGITNEIVTFDNGQKVIDYLFSEECDQSWPNTLHSFVVLLDLNMPVLDGCQVLKTLKSNDRTSHIPIIILSTSDHPQEKALCEKLGCQGFITKPVDYDSFTQAISRIVGLLTQLHSSPLMNGRSYI
jgi:CheY-like chemotaxis protein